MPTNRPIIQFDHEKCTGCGECIPACHEGAIQIIEGKATLIADHLCDGLGDCLKECPFGAIQVIQRSADAYDQQAVQAHLLGQMPGSCLSNQPSLAHQPQWPLQLHLVPEATPYFQGADLLISATCVAVACPSYHQAILQDKPVVIACPKLDSTGPYTAKLAQIIQRNNLRSLTIAKIAVPCCNGLVKIVQDALVLAKSPIPLTMITVDTNGHIIE